MPGEGGRDSGELGSGSNQQEAKHEPLREAGFLVPAFRKLSSSVFFWLIFKKGFPFQ